MKNLIVIGAFLLGFQSFVQAQDVQWVTLSEAEKMVREDPSKKIFVNFYTDWCGFCRKMSNKTFGDKTVAQEMNQKFINVRFNAEGKDKVEFLNKTYRYLPNAGRNGVHFFAYVMMRGRLSYPTSVILDNRGVKTKIISGYLNPKEFLERISEKG